MSHLLAAGNEKLGHRIKSFSLPKGETCPGKSELCDQKCYVNRFARFNLDEVYGANLEECRSPDFVENACREIQSSSIRIIRMHVSGDFWSAAYIRKWIKIVKRNPDRVFYAYTRSWRVARLRRALDDLRRLPNMQLWWSTDKMCEIPPEGRVAYMSVSDDDVPAAEVGATLVFRTNRKTVQRRLGKILVCVKENGIPTKETCGTCRVCYKHAMTLDGQRNRPSTRGQSL